MRSTKRLWAVLALVTIVSFAVLGLLGREVYRQAPPIPEQVRSATGDVLLTAADIMKGQQVWQSIGGHQLGSIWGHGSYVAPDWTADWLHREAVALLDGHALARYGQYYAGLDEARRATLEAVVRLDMRRNTHHPESGVVTVSTERAAAIRQQSGVMQTLVWLRVPGDVVFALGAVLLALFVARLFVPPRKRAGLLEPETVRTPGT